MYHQQQPQPLPDKASKHYGDMWSGVDKTWFEAEFPTLAKFFFDKFHNGKYHDKGRWPRRSYRFYLTQNPFHGPGITRIYIVINIYPYWFYSVEMARSKSSMLAAILRGMLMDEWK